MRSLPTGVDAVPPIRRASLSGVAEFFAVKIEAVRHWTRTGCPFIVRGEQGVEWVFDLLQVVEWRYQRDAKATNKAKNQVGDPEQMKVRDRLDYYKGCRERDTWMQERNQLLPYDSVLALVAAELGRAKNALRRKPVAMASKLALMEDEHEIRRFLATQIDEALMALSEKKMLEKKND